MQDWHAFAATVLAVVVGIVVYEIVSSALGGSTASPL